MSNEVGQKTKDFDEWRDGRRLLDAFCLHKAEEVLSHPDSWDNLPRLRLHLFSADPFTHLCFVSREQASTRGNIHVW